MPTPSEPSIPNPNEAVVHISGAKKLLQELQQKTGSHPELGEAITKLELALNVLGINTGGLL
jgi:hypothetical protein